MSVSASASVAEPPRLTSPDTYVAGWFAVGTGAALGTIVIRMYAGPP